MSKKLDNHHYSLILFSVLCLFSVISGGAAAKLGDDAVGCVVKRNERESIVSTELGEISRVRLSDGNQSFQLHFFTLEPNSLLLPLLLHEDMVFFVRTGSGVISYLDEDKRESRNIKRGDIHRLRAGSVFYLQSDLDDPERHKLRLHAIFGTSGPDFTKAKFEPYTTIRDLVLGFDKQVLQQIFQVPEEVIEEMTSEPKPSAIIQAIPSKEKNMWEKEQEYLADLLLGGKLFQFHSRNKKKESKVYNIFNEKPDFKNCNGWSTTVNRKKYSPLRNSQYGIFMVNLTTGSMMGPHWNPMATEIAVVIEGKGMVRVACSSGLSDTECKNTRISVEEGDAFVVPRYHPMGHMAFNNETFVFVGFSTATKINHPQFLAGQASVLRTLDKEILARSFGVSNETLDRLLANQGESVILKCTSCAEEEWKLMQEEIKKEREEKREREQEEARKKKEEQRRRQEEEESKKREEEAARERKEEQEREEREREEAKRKEKEHKRHEEERRRQEEEEAKKQEEEAERQRREEQEREEAQRKEEEQRRREEERQKQEEEEAAARQEKEEAKRKEEEQKRQEEERQKQEEEEAARQEKEEAKRIEEEQKRQEEERQKQEEEEAERQRREQHEREEREREASRQQEQEQEQQKAREREEAARREREEQQAEEMERQRQQEEREAQEKEEAAKKEREEEEAREQEEAQKRREEEQEQAERQARQRAQEQEQAQQQKEQREAEARSEEEAARRQEEKPQQETEEEHRGEQKEQREAEARSEEEAARRQEEKPQQEIEEEHRGEGTGIRRTV